MADLNRLYQRLRDEEARLARELGQRLTQQSGEQYPGSPFGTEEDEASQVSATERRLALEKGLTTVLAEVRHALGKFENGSYGLCDCCGQPIGEERLEALPQASLCLSCKAKHAKGKAG